MFEVGYMVKDFDLSDNLMIECGIEESGGALVTNNGDRLDRFFSGALFEQCVVLVMHRLGG